MASVSERKVLWAKAEKALDEAACSGGHRSELLRAVAEAYIRLAAETRAL